MAFILKSQTTNHYGSTKRFMFQMSVAGRSALEVGTETTVSLYVKLMYIRVHRVHLHNAFPVELQGTSVATRSTLSSLCIITFSSSSPT